MPSVRILGGHARAHPTLGLALALTLTRWPRLCYPGFPQRGGGKPGTMPAVDEAGEAEPEAAAGGAGAAEAAAEGGEPGAAARRLAAARSPLSLPSTAAVGREGRGSEG